MTYQDFTGFTFNNVHSSTFNVYAVSASNRFSSNFSGSIKNNTLSVQGYEGEYFFGTNLGKKTITITCATDSITEDQLRGLQHWLRPGQTGQLIEDGLEYKYTSVTLGKIINFNFVPFNGTYNTNVYKGDFKITFDAFDPYSYSTFSATNDFTFDEDTSWHWESGVLYDDWAPDVSYDWSADPVTEEEDVFLYNGGNASSSPIITISGTWTELTLTNQQTSQSFTLDANDGTYGVEVDCGLAQIKVNSVLSNSLHHGDFIKIKGTGLKTEVDVTTTSSDGTVTLDSGTWEANVAERFLFLDGEYYYIDSRTDGTSIEVLPAVTTGQSSVEGVIVDANIITITGTAFSITNIEFAYKYVYY